MADIKIEIRDCEKKRKITFESDELDDIRNVVDVVAKALGVTVEIPQTRKGGG